MARWGKCDFRELEELDRKLEHLTEADFDAFCREGAKLIARQLLAKVRKRTPVGVAPGDLPESIRAEYWSGYQGGTLRRAWQVLPIEKKGTAYLVTVANNTEYASYVEYGHRQRPGRYVPALGKRLTASWVDGKFMLTISTQEVEQQAPRKLEQLLYKTLKEVF